MTFQTQHDMITENSPPHDRLKASHMWGFIFLKDLWRSHCDACSGHGFRQKMSIDIRGTGLEDALTR